MFSLCALLLLSVATTADLVNKTKMIGSLTTLHYKVSGDLYAVDEKTLMLKNFTYTGAGPDAYFWIGTEGTPRDPVDEEKTAILAHPFEGQHYEYRNKDAPVLHAYSQETLTLTLPPNIRVSDLKWFAIWCRSFSTNFGYLMVPAEFMASDASSELETVEVTNNTESVTESVPKTVKITVPVSEPVQQSVPKTTNITVAASEPVQESVPKPEPVNTSEDEDILEDNSEPDPSPGCIGDGCTYDRSSKRFYWCENGANKEFKAIADWRLGTGDVYCQQISSMKVTISASGQEHSDKELVKKARDECAKKFGRVPSGKIICHSEKIGSRK